MAWTASRTYTAGEIITASILNTHIRDNQLYLKSETDLYDTHDATEAYAAHGNDIGSHTHQTAGAQGNTLDHGLSLTGLTDDDHPQYQKESLLTTAGDIAYATGDSAWARLAIGTANQVLRTNAGATAPEWAARIQPTAVFKSADETVNNSAALQNDDELLFAVGTAEKWIFQIILYVNSGTGADIKCAITLPANATMNWSVAPAYFEPGGVATIPVVVTASGTSLGIGCNAAETGVVIFGSVESTDTGGNVQLQWAQESATEADLIVKEGSHLLAHAV